MNKSYQPQYFSRDYNYELELRGSDAPTEDVRKWFIDRTIKEAEKRGYYYFWQVHKTKLEPQPQKGGGRKLTITLIAN